MKLSGVTSNRRCSALQMVRLTVTFPRSVEDQKSIRKPEGREGGGQDQVDSGSLSPGQIPPAGSESISRGVCSQAAPDYGKVIHLDALPPPPPTLGSLHWADCRALSVPALLRSAQPVLLQVRRGGGKNTNQVVSYSFFKAVGVHQRACGLPRALCVPACLRREPQGEMARVLPGRTLSSESSLSGHGIVYDSILFAIKQPKKEALFMIWKPRAGAWMRERKIMSRETN